MIINRMVPPVSCS